MAIQKNNENLDKKEKGFIYYRVSTEMQNLRMQKNTAKRFLESQVGENIEIIDTFEDEAMSGALGYERPDFNDMINRLNEIDCLIIYAWDRLSREERFAMNLMYDLREKNIYVYEASTGLKLDFDQLHNRMITVLNSMKASEERIIHKQRTVDGIKGYRVEHDDKWGPNKKYGGGEKGNKYSEERFWFEYERYRLAKVKKSSIARLFSISRTTLYKRLNDNPEKYQKIENKLK